MIFFLGPILSVRFAQQSFSILVAILPTMEKHTNPVLLVPSELWLLISHQLPIPARKNLAQASKHFHRICLPLLYQSVDLSVHHFRPETNEKNFIVKRWPDNLQETLGRQSLFMRQLLENPQYAQMVHSFTWTMGLHRISALPDWAEEDGSSPFHNLENVYTLFQTLEQATHVDVDGGPIHPYPSISLPPLFPNARKLRVGGQMHYSLASAILHGPHKAPLESLSIYSLHERGRLRSGQNFTESDDAPPLEEDWPEDSLPIQVGPGTMRRIFTPELTVRCVHHLQNLTVTQLQTTLPRFFGIIPPQWQNFELDIHRECASFIRSVKPPLLGLRYLSICPDLAWALQIRFPIQTSVMPPSKVFGFDGVFWPLLSEGWSGLKEIHLSNVNPNAIPLPQGVSDAKDVLYEPNLLNLEGVKVHYDAKADYFWNELRMSD